MALPVIIVENQTAGTIFLSRLGLTVPASGTLTLTDFAFENEIRSDEDLQSAVVAGNLLLNFGQGALTQGESLKFFNLVTLETRIPVKALSDTNIGSLSGTTTVDTIALSADDRVLLTNQSSAVQNGIWVVKTGAWQRPDDFGSGQSASMAIVAVDEGATYAEQVWQCTTDLGSDVIDTNNLAFQQISGSGASVTLQAAYDAGNTITTAGGTDIDFTLSSGDFVVDDGSILFGGGTALTAFEVDTGTMSLDSTDTTNLTMTANDAGDKTLTIAASNSGAGDGLIAMSSDGETDIDAGGALSLNSSGGAINIGDDADAQPINIGTGAAARTLTLGNQTGASTVDIDAGTGGINGDTTGSITLEADAASSWNVTGAGLSLSTTSSGDITTNSAGSTDFQSAGNLTIDSSAGDIGIGADADDGDINIGTGTTAGRDITIGNTTGTTGVTIEATSTGQVTIDSPTTTLTGDLVVQGTTTTVESETVNVKDNFFYMNDGYTTTTGLEGGLVINYLPTATNDTVAAGGFTAGVTAVSNPTVATAGAATFSANDFIQISGAADQSNDGLYEVLSHAANVLTVTGVGTTGRTYSFTQNDFTTDSTAQGTITKVNISAIQTDTSGDWQVGSGSDSSAFTWTDITTGATSLTLQTAYEGGNTITTSVGDGDVVIAGTESLQVTATNGLDVDTVFDFDGTSFDVQMTGANGFSIDGAAASNLTVDGGNLTLDTTTSGEVLVDGIDGVEINSSGGAIDIGNDADTGAINVGTGAAARTITVGNSTGATGVNIVSGSEMVEIDGVTYYGLSNGNPVATGSGFQDGDKYYDTGIDKEMRYDGTRAKWLSVETAYIQIGRNFNTAPGQYYRGINGQIMSATTGYPAFYNGTVVGFAYTRGDSDAATFEIVEGGTNRATVASSATSGRDNSLNGDFSQDGILAVRNAAGGNTTSDVMAWVAFKWRA